MMSTRISKACSGALGMLIITAGILFLSAGSLDCNSAAAQNEAVLASGQSGNSTAVIMGDRIAVNESVFLLQDALTGPLKLQTGDGQPAGDVTVDWLEIREGESIFGPLGEETIENLDRLDELSREAGQVLTLGFTVVTDGRILTAGLGSLLPVGTLIEDGASIELVFDPAVAAGAPGPRITAAVRPLENAASSGGKQTREPSVHPAQIGIDPIVGDIGPIIIDKPIIDIVPRTYYDQLVVAQGFGGDTIINIRNFDPEIAPLTSVRQSFSGAAVKFQQKIGGGEGRTAYISTGDVNNDGSPDVVLSFGPILSDATFANIVVVRNADTREVIGHSFIAFPAGEGSDVNYNGGEIRTAVGDFIGSGTPQIATAQGRGGNGMIRLYQYTGRPAPLAWEVVGQFYGLPPNLVVQGDNVSERIGLNLAAGDLDGDGLDELVVGQGNGPKSQTIFHVLDITSDGTVENRFPYAGFKTKFRGNGGIELCVTDLNGDSLLEIVAASMGNLQNFGDVRDTTPINLASIIAVSVNDNQIAGFWRPGGKSVFNAFTKDVNPSGALCVVAGEFDGNITNGKELVFGTGAYEDFSFRQILLQKTAPQTRYRLLKAEYDGEVVTNITSWIGSGEGFTGFLDAANPKSGAVYLGVIERVKHFPVTPAPPTELALGDFTLTVEEYDTYQWATAYSTVAEASGIAWTEFDCNNPTFIGTIIGIAELYPVTFQVVETVTNPNTQISIIEALEFNPSIAPGQNLVLYLPEGETLQTEPLVASDLATRLEIDRSMLGILALREGEIKVQFRNCTIEVDSTDSTKGTITLGRACYPTETPTESPYPSQLSVQTAGFKTILSSLCISPSSATAEAELELPVSLTSGLDCRAANVDLGEITITQDCQYKKSLPDEAFGVWQVCNTGMQIFGIGLVADFSKTWSYSGTPSLSADWRGVVLIGGETVPGDPNTTLSNYGYMKARYSFSNALVTATGLTTEFSLMEDFQFTSLQPLDYIISLTSGGLSMSNCAITGGSFSNGKITLPKAAIVDNHQNPIAANYTALTVQSDMDLYSESLTINQDFMWGELSRTSPPYYAYKAEAPDSSYFYLSASLKNAYWPLDAGGFKSPTLYGDMKTVLETQGIQGLTATDLMGLTAFTPDTPNKKEIYFKFTDRSWMIVGAQGVHAWFRIENFENPLEMGPTHESYYEGLDNDGNKVPFLTNLAIDWKQERMAEFKFVDSALYENDLSGQVRLEGPTKADVPFEELQFTSTAHIAGARIVLSTAVPLDYWGVNLVQNPNSSTAGVMSVKTGQIFLTGAGIEEKRHYAQPFWLTWGEIMSSGQLDELKFDYNSAGQRFDEFPFVADGIGLSPWDITDDTDKKKAYLQAGGTVYFDFFGAQYNNIKDFNYLDKPDYPYNGRRIELTNDTAFNTQPTESNINRMWGNSFGVFDYDIGYDDGDQDGYVGNGVMQFFNLVDGQLSSSIVLSSTRICMRVYSATEGEHHDFTVGPVAHFGQMARTTGCACVVDGQVERVHLSAELETSNNLNIALRSASYSNLEFDLTPSTWDLWIYGNMYLSLLAGADIEVTGEAHFAVNRDEAYVEGEISGKIETASLLGGGLTAEGRLEWHLGAPVSSTSYQSLQGRVALELIAPIGSNACEGGFYVGLNAPKDRAWILADAGGRYSLNPNLLPDRLTGVYGYIRQSSSINLYIVSGGYEVYAGLGAFVDLGTNPGVNIATISAGVPHLVTNLGLRIWGKILGGLVSASASGNLQLMVGPPPDPFGFEGSLNLEACVLWVFCGDVDVSCGLNSNEGFYLR